MSLSNSRFVRVSNSDCVGSYKIFSRSDVQSYRLDDYQFEIGDFFARIWSFFGKPDFVSYEGFEYTFKDIENGIVFSAYSGASGPSYGGRCENEQLYKDSIQAFEKLLEGAQLVDCKVKFFTDFGILITGAKDGDIFIDFKQLNTFTYIFLSILNIARVMITFLIYRIFK